MAEFLSDAWFAELADAAATATTPDDLSLVIEQAVHGSSSGVWHLVISGGSISVIRDHHAAPDIRLLSDHETAEGIRGGTLSAQRAFLEGRLQIGGDIQALIAHRETLGALAPLLGVT